MGVISLSKPLFLFGNGLSMALSTDFALRNITQKFVESLDGEDREFLEEICSKKRGLSFDDFEENFTLLEASYENLRKYQSFIRSDVGKKFLKRFGLKDPKLQLHEAIIERIYKGYISRVLEIIHGNVRLDKIQEKISKFVSFLVDEIASNDKTYIFTLNYDLLVETILLQYVGSDGFTDFCCPSGKLKGTEIDKFDFNPRRNEEFFSDTNQNVELHHLHGSLSLFYDFDRNRAVKLRSQDIGYEEIYRKIYAERMPLTPAIITGGGKSDKIVQYPFDFYYRSMKDLCDSGQPSKFFIVGYSFRDQHINDLIKRWLKNVQEYSKGLLIVDYKTSQKEREDFMSFVRKQIPKKPAIPEFCFEFGGVEAIHDITGTKAKKKRR